MKFCRINLLQTNYTQMKLGKEWNYIVDRNLIDLNKIYNDYCLFKKFDSVMPIFESQYKDSSTDIIGYFNHGELVAWDMIKLHDDQNAEAMQFAWNYVHPELRLGIESLKNACAIYKQRGFKYLYLGTTAKYKQEISGYEELGPV